MSSGRGQAPMPHIAAYCPKALMGHVGAWQGEQQPPQEAVYATEYPGAQEPEQPEDDEEQRLQMYRQQAQYDAMLREQARQEQEMREQAAKHLRH